MVVSALQTRITVAEAISSDCELWVGSDTFGLVEAAEKATTDDRTRLPQQVSNPLSERTKFEHVWADTLQMSVSQKSSRSTTTTGARHRVDLVLGFGRRFFTKVLYRSGQMLKWCRIWGFMCRKVIADLGSGAIRTRLTSPQHYCIRSNSRKRSLSSLCALTFQL